MKSKIIEFAKKHSYFRFFLRKMIFCKNWLKNIPNLFVKVDEKLVVFESYMGRSYDCSPKAIYEYMLSDSRFNDYQFVWAFKFPYEDQLEKKYKKDKRTKVVEYRSKEYYSSYSKAKYWITNSRLPEEIIKKKNQIYLQCWHGTPLKRLGHDIIENTQNAMNNKKEIRKRYDCESSKFDYFISPSAFASEKFKSAFNIIGENVLIEKGYPRNDSLFTYEKSDIINFKKTYNIPLDKKVILYAPTFRDNEHKADLGYTYTPHIDFKYLQKKLGEEYVILYRPHYLVANLLDLSMYDGFVYYHPSFIGNTNELYICSDILITDYSSAFFDYANLNRPMIFYMYDLEFYENDLRGFYLSLDELPGDIVPSEKEIVDIVNNLGEYNKKHNEKYQKLKSKYLYLDDKNATKRVIDVVFGGKKI